MNTILSKFALLIGFAASLCGAEIKVVLNPESQKLPDVLIVMFPRKVAVTKGQATLKYKILNRSSEDIFVVVESECVDGWTELKGSSGYISGGGIYEGMESTHESLRLLYAPRRSEDGSPSEGEDARMSETIAEVRIDSGPNKDLSNWIGASGTLHLRLKFYVGNSKDRRTFSLAVPVEIQKAVQATPSNCENPSN